MASIDLQNMGKRARDAAFALAQVTSAAKHTALRTVADALEYNRAAILAANRRDLDAAAEAGHPAALIRDRFDLARRLDEMIGDVRKVAALPDPVGEEFDQRTLANGLKVSRRRTPLGVLGVIYEARPNVTIDVAALALKTGNAVIMRGGKETFQSNMELVRVLGEALATCGLPADAVQYIASTDRDYVLQMLKQHRYIDMIIPRGGASLHDFCRENSTIPVITGGLGICHLFVDQTARFDAALNVIHNAKTQRPSVCNALDTLLVHEAVAADFLPQLVDHLRPAGVTFRAEPRALAHLAPADDITPAGAQDFDTEWMALILGLKVVGSLDDAIAHIRQHSTQHSDGILTEDAAHAARFLNEVDSAAVYVNASTRFTDGSALELGAEVAVSTQKLHARGPMALEALTTYKWIVIGDGHIRP